MASTSRPGGDGSQSLHWLRLWQWIFNLGLLATGLVVVSGASRRALIFVAFLPIAFVPFSYARLLAHRLLIRDLGARSAGPALVLGIAFDLVMAAQLVTGRMPEQVPFLHGDTISWIGPVWFSAHALLFLGSAVTAGVRALARIAHRATRVVVESAGLRTGGRYDHPQAQPRNGGPHRSTHHPVHSRSTPATTTDEPVSLGRREALKQLGILGVGAPFALSLSGVPLSYDFRVDERELALPDWPRELDGLRVVHLSDIHVGGAMNRERLRRVAELTLEAKPDIVLHTGDFLTHRSGEFDTPLYEALSMIEAPYGQWACLGNHDFDDVERFVRHLRDAGVATLRDRAATLLVQGQALELGGLDFPFGRNNVAAHYAAVTGTWSARETTPRILLNHDPRGFYALPEGVADLVLSGHTHGGHIGIQLGRDRALTVVGLAGIPDQGVFTRGDMRLFVTRCVGFYGYPMRIGIPPEISVLVLRKA